jgi:putative tricarboxylic transport membrane protein
LKLGRDGWAGLAILIASLVLFGLTLGLKGNPMVPIGPGFYPRIVLGVTALLAAWLVLADLLARRNARPRAPTAPVHYGMVAAMFALFGLYVGALPPLGFRVATFAYVAAVNALLDPPRGVRGYARVALVALLTAAATYVVFERELLVLLPRGRWTGF